MRTSPTTRRLLRPEDLRRFENFHFAARAIVEGFYAGRHRSPHHDASAEFHDYRPYVPGDDLRALDRRASARLDRDYVKLFRKESDLRCHLVLDSSRSMEYAGSASKSRAAWGNAPGVSAFRRLLRCPAPNPEVPALDTSAPLSRFEYAAYLAAALAYLMIRQGDKVSLAVGGSDIKTYLPPGGTITHLHALLHALEMARPDGGTQIARVLKRVFPLARRRGLLIVISDLLEEPKSLFDALALYAHHGWQIWLLHVLTEDELELPGEGPARFEDTEGGGDLEADPDDVRTAYRAEVEAWLSALENGCKARAVQYQRLDTRTPLDTALERFLKLR